MNTKVWLYSTHSTGLHIIIAPYALPESVYLMSEKLRWYITTRPKRKRDVTEDLDDVS